MVWVWTAYPKPFPSLAQLCIPSCFVTDKYPWCYLSSRPFLDWTRSSLHTLQFTQRRRESYQKISFCPRCKVQVDRSRMSNSGIYLEEIIISYWLSNFYLTVGLKLKQRLLKLQKVYVFLNNLLLQETLLATDNRVHAVRLCNFIFWSFNQKLQ